MRYADLQNDGFESPVVVYVRRASEEQGIGSAGSTPISLTPERRPVAVLPLRKGDLTFLVRCASDVKIESSCCASRFEFATGTPNTRPGKP